MKTPVPSKGIQIYVSKFTIFRQANTSCLQVYDKNKKVRYIVIKLKSTGAGKKDLIGFTCIAFTEFVKL